MKKAIQISYGESPEKIIRELERMGLIESGGSSRYEVNMKKFVKFGTVVLEFIEE